MLWTTPGVACTGTRLSGGGVVKCSECGDTWAAASSSTAAFSRHLSGPSATPLRVERPGASEEEARARGVVLHEGTATALKALAGRYGVETPPEFAALDASRSKPSLYAQA